MATAPKAAERLKEIFAAAGARRASRLAPGRRATPGDVRKRGRGRLRDACGRAAATAPSTAAASPRSWGGRFRSGVLPLGTLNHFAKDLGIPLDLEEAARVVLEGAGVPGGCGRGQRADLPQQLQPGGLSGRSCGCGTSTSATVGGKWIAALWAGLTVLRRSPFMAVRIVAEERPWSGVRRWFWWGTTNTGWRASRPAPANRSLGGQLALYVLNAERRPGLLRLAWQVLLQGAEQVKELDLITVEEATVETRRRRLQVAARR